MTSEKSSLFPERGDESRAVLSRFQEAMLDSQLSKVKEITEIHVGIVNATAGRSEWGILLGVSFLAAHSPHQKSFLRKEQGDKADDATTPPYACFPACKFRLSVRHNHSHFTLINRTLMYESKAHPPLPRRQFARRVLRHAAVALALLLFSLLLGMAGYMYFEHLPWRDAFLNAAMLMGGMGPVDAPHTDGGKLFAGLYALYAGLLFLVIAGIVLTPVVHRVMHTFHWEEDQ